MKNWEKKLKEAGIKERGSLPNTILEFEDLDNKKKYILGLYGTFYKNIYDVKRGMKETGFDQERWLHYELTKKLFLETLVFDKYCKKRGFERAFFKRDNDLKKTINKRFPWWLKVWLYTLMCW